MFLKNIFTPTIKPHKQLVLVTLPEKGVYVTENKMILHDNGCVTGISILIFFCV